ncbi:hypothetical protein PF010_g19989 [Phytophthora fragariae]|uniref:Replication protein A OB domain-containing protein n=1 Tax=Phytophthora fragariae TaxID=53985 RepID=A0A6G0KFJ8_9STRA|nr:hypothetical protein PF010_g19989 [Phytophthora fragariae]
MSANAQQEMSSNASLASPPSVSQRPSTPTQSCPGNVSADSMPTCTDNTSASETQDHEPTIVPAKSSTANTAPIGARTKVDQVEGIVPKTNSRTRYLFKQLTTGVPATWVFFARVLARNPVREYQNLHGGGKFLEAFVSDTAGDVIRITLFNTAVNQFRDVIEPGITCSFSMGRLKPSTRSVVTVPLEATFDGVSEIREISTDQFNIVEPSLHPAVLSAFKDTTHGSTVTTLAVVHVVDGLKRVKTKKGAPLEKRDFLVVDDTDTKLVCTSWGMLVRNLSDGVQGQVIMIFKGQISDYNETRSVNIGVPTSVLFEPALTRAQQLLSWYSSLAPNHSFSLVHA